MLTKETQDRDHIVQVLIPTDADRGTRYQLNKYVDWLVDQGRQWHSPDLSAYRDYLLAAGSKHGKPLSPYTVKAHLSTIRTRYQDILKEQQATDSNSKENSDQLARFEALVDRIQKAIDPEESKVEIDQQDGTPESDKMYLSEEEVQALVNAPDTGTLDGLRDRAIIALMVGTGIRDVELAAVDVEDLRQDSNGELALRVRATKSAKERLVPYGENEWVLPLVEQWLQAAEIQDGAAFRSFWRGNKRLRGRLSARAVQMIVSGYTTQVGSKQTIVLPSNLRKTFAVHLYDATKDLDLIRKNLGLATFRGARSLIEN